MSHYSVKLVKSAYGLGIYFAAAADGTAAIVDTDVPFYRLPSGALAPGEESGVISPGDVLVSVNDSDVSVLSFRQIVELLRQVPEGPVTLGLQRQEVKKDEVSPETHVEASEEKPSLCEHEAAAENERPKGWTMFKRLSAVSSLSSIKTDALVMQELVGKLREMEETLAREQKCRFLSERKNVLYRNELMRVSQENVALRDELAQLKLEQKRQDTFVSNSLYLAI